MEWIEFTIHEGLKILALLFLGLFSAKSIAGLAPQRIWVKPLLYSVLLGLAGVGAWRAGNDVAAEVYLWNSGAALAKGDSAQAYSDIARAVERCPDSIAYWRVLLATKVRLGQYQSALDDEAAFRSMNRGKLDEGDDYRFAFCYYALGQDDRVVQSTARLIHDNPAFAGPYILQGLAETARKNYPQAEASFRTVLQLFPSNQAAVEGLARACYLAGERQKALMILNQTEKFQFSEPARQRFEALKGLYDQ